MKLLGFAKKVARIPYYRWHPVHIVRLAYTTWMFSRFRITDPVLFLRSLGLDPDVGLAGLESWRQPLADACAAVQNEPGQGGISWEEGLVLYGVTRCLRPEHVVETGVAAGISTSFIGAALIENRRGVLYSIELPNEGEAGGVLADGSLYRWSTRGVGWAIPAAIREQLHGRHFLRLQDVRIALPALLQELPGVDLFFHDDLHTPDHMLWEYELVWPRLRPGGLLLSDDANFGWIDFCQRQGLPRDALRNMLCLTAARKPKPAVKTMLPRNQ